MFIPAKKAGKGLEVGDRVITTMDHTAMVGTMLKGTMVTIIEMDPTRGYAIEDDEGNRLIECGWVI